ncbi:MAG: serine/threonine-protein kinase, partial [Planctomycetota bacterium]
MNGPGPSDDRDETRDHSAPPPPGTSPPDASTAPVDSGSGIDPAETLPFAPPPIDRPTTALPESSYPQSTTEAEPAELPSRIGPFRPVERIATGGMGTVYEAEQDNPRRSVALKILRESAATPDVLRRFEVETRILAQLRHPGIAQIYEAGTFDHRGCELPYYAMELVEGARPIREYAQEHQLSIEEKLDLFLEVCDAVHHGHQRGVIHRDLKPANILVDRDGRAKVIDFGVARAADLDVLGTTA